MYEGHPGARSRLRVRSRSGIYVVEGTPAGIRGASRSGIRLLLEVGSKELHVLKLGSKKLKSSHFKNQPAIYGQSIERLVPKEAEPCKQKYPR